MNILLDTHVFLWWLIDSLQLSQSARTLIQEADSVYVSSISIWEAAIKKSLGKLDADIKQLARAIDSEGFLELSFTLEHAIPIGSLLHHHRDPFDRALIAQAMTHPLRLVTADAALKPYSELVMIV